MSIEAAIVQLAEAVASLAAAVNGADTNDTTNSAEGKRRGRPAKTEPVTTAPVTTAPVPAAPPVMPAPPFIAQAVAPTPAPAEAEPVSVPFTDAQGLMQYVMASYKAMGPEKGARIQQVLVGMGKTNVNEITPDLYGAFFSQVEALKKGG